MRNAAIQLSEEPLGRKGSELRGRGRRWQMMSVQGPLELPGADQSKEYFRIETANKETLLVYRGSGEKGMRQLYLLNLSRS
jgi:hypothetical protein